MTEETAGTSTVPASPAGKILVVTTFNEAGWLEYGQRFVATFREFWPANCELLVYADGFNPPATENAPPVRWTRLDLRCKKLQEFKERHAGNPGARGIFGKDQHWRLDAVKFANKVFAYADAVERENATLVIWCDADVVAFAPIPVGWLESLMPDFAQVAYLERKRTHPETGFIMLRADDPDTRMFTRMMTQTYADDGVFNLPEWHDAFVFLVILRTMRDKGIVQTHSLSGPAVDTDHPFINGPLGAYFDHYKGLRKDQGHSDAADLTWARPEPYWRRIQQGVAP